MKNKKSKVVVALSGGVDSAVSAWYLKNTGYDIIGVFLRLNTDAQANEAMARQVANKLKIKFYPINVVYKFNRRIIDYFISGYARGITPNPCVKCNKLIKFGELLRISNELGTDFLATGHYARLQQGALIKLLRGLDLNKDQSYFLYNLTQEQLQKILFPLGDRDKKEIKKIADKEKLPYSKKESQDICFLARNGKNIEHNDFLKKKINLKPGSIKTLSGKIIGRHLGLPLYTIGQRKGIELGGTGPYYVAKTDYKTNILYVVNNVNDPILFKNNFLVSDINWISGKKPKFPLNCEVAIRYRHQAVKCQITLNQEKNVIVKLEKLERAVTPGQSAVFYRQDEVIGGGIIKV